MTSPLRVGDLINSHDTNALIRLVQTRESAKTVHAVVMNWFASNAGAKTLENFTRNGYIPAYSAYLLEYYLKLK